MFSFFTKKSNQHSPDEYESLLEEQTDSYNKFYVAIKMSVYAFIKSVDEDKAAMLLATGKLETYTVSDMFTVLSECVRDIKSRVNELEDELEWERKRSQQWEDVAEESNQEVTFLKNRIQLIEINHRDRFLEK